MLAGATAQQQAELREAILESLGEVPQGLNEKTELRKLSLKRLDAAIRECLDKGEPLPDSISCLGGLQAIRYVLVDLRQNDIILIGPAEAWKLNERGAIVGETTGRPVLLLDDLLVALRAARAPVRSVISCSIEPTAEGIQRLNNFTRGRRRIGNPQATAMGFEQNLGPQKISVTGVPDTSHFARVLVAADYRMKRIGMSLEPAPIPGLPGFLQLIPANARRAGNVLPRWWLAPDHEPLLRDADGLTWELRGVSVKAMAESDFFDAAGTRRETVQADPASQKWADMMTERYGELATAEPVFGQLRNCMDLAIVAALIVGESLPEKAQVQLPMLLDEGPLATAELPAPKQVDSKATVAKKGRTWFVACGGVQINPWAIVQSAEQSGTLAAVRSTVGFDGQTDRWWE